MKNNMKYLQEFENYYDDNERELIDLCFKNFSIKMSNTNQLIKRFKLLKGDVEFWNYLELNAQLGKHKVVALVGESRPSYWIMENERGIKTLTPHWNLLYIIKEGTYNALKKKFVNYKFQKAFLKQNPFEYKKIKDIGFAPGIEDEFSYIWNGEDMGLL